MLVVRDHEPLARSGQSTCIAKIVRTLLAVEDPVELLQMETAPLYHPGDLTGLSRMKSSPDIMCKTGTRREHETNSWCVEGCWAWAPLGLSWSQDGGEEPVVLESSSRRPLGARASE